MNYLTNAGALILQFAFGAVVTLFVLRLLAEAYRADFHNPICQFLYRFTNPVLRPLRKALPNIVGGADIWGRTTNAGGTTVRFVGTQGPRAVFERTDVVVESNATTMTESPMIIPTTTRTTVHGNVGMTPVSGTARSTSYEYIPPRGSSQYATTQRPVAITLGSGQSVSIQGRTLRVVSVAPNALKYIVE